MESAFALNFIPQLNSQLGGPILRRKGVAQEFIFLAAF
jgi:hypothetical protein